MLLKIAAVDHLLGINRSYLQQGEACWRKIQNENKKNGPERRMVKFVVSNRQNGTNALQRLNAAYVLSLI